MPATALNSSQVTDILREIAREYHELGPGYAQDTVVLREAAHRLRVRDLHDAQLVLKCWQDLFRQGELVWGYDLDTPTAPFFHVPRT